MIITKVVAYTTAGNTLGWLWQRCAGATYRTGGTRKLGDICGWASALICQGSQSKCFLASVTLNPDAVWCYPKDIFYVRHWSAVTDGRINFCPAATFRQACTGIPARKQVRLQCPLVERGLKQMHKQASRQQPLGLSLLRTYTAKEAAILNWTGIFTYLPGNE